MLYRVQTGSGAHPASCPVGIGSSFPRDKAAGEWRWPLSSIYAWSYISTPPYVFIAWCL